MLIIVVENRIWSVKDVRSCTAGVATSTQSLVRCSNLSRPTQQTARLTVKPHLHRYEFESTYLYTGSSKHYFACILMATIHIDMSSDNR